MTIDIGIGIEMSLKKNRKLVLMNFAYIYQEEFSKIHCVEGKGQSRLQCSKTIPHGQKKGSAVISSKVLLLQFTFIHCRTSI